jgi:hypothetical protein
MGAIDYAHPARADHVDHGILPDLLYQRIRTFQTALGYLRWTRSGFQGGVLIRKAKNASLSALVKVEFAPVTAEVLQPTMVTQTFNRPIRFFR